MNFFLNNINIIMFFLYEIKKALEEYKTNTIDIYIFIHKITKIMIKYNIKKIGTNNEYKKISKIIDEIIEFYHKVRSENSNKLRENIEIIENIPDLSHYEYLKIKKTLVNLKNESYYNDEYDNNEKIKNYINLLDVSLQNIYKQNKLNIIDYILL